MIFNYYQITNLVNGRAYIGITELPIEERYKKHVQLLEKHTHPNYHLQPDWDKFGQENFQLSLIESKEYDNLEDGYYHEYELIQNSTLNLYNIQPGGIVNPIKNQESYEKMVQTKQQQVPNVYCLEEVTENQFKIIGEYPSQKAAGRANSNWNQGNINKAIQRHIKSNGYYWVLQNDIDTKLSNWKPTRTRFRPTAVLDEKGNIEQVHHNAREFEKENNYRVGAVSASICHGTFCHHKKYIYISEEEYYKRMPIVLIK